MIEAMMLLTALMSQPEGEAAAEPREEEECPDRADDQCGNRNHPAQRLRDLSAQGTSDQQTERQEGQILPDRNVEQRRIENAQGADHHAHAERDPERSEGRPAVALTDVLPGERTP